MVELAAGCWSAAATVASACATLAIAALVPANPASGATLALAVAPSVALGRPPQHFWCAGLANGGSARTLCPSAAADAGVYTKHVDTRAAAPATRALALRARSGCPAIAAAAARIGRCRAQRARSSSAASLAKRRRRAGITGVMFCAARDTAAASTRRTFASKSAARSCHAVCTLARNSATWAAAPRAASCPTSRSAARAERAALTLQFVAARRCRPAHSPAARSSIADTSACRVATSATTRSAASSCQGFASGVTARCITSPVTSARSPVANLAAKGCPVATAAPRCATGPRGRR